MGDQPMSLVALQEDPMQSWALEQYPITLAICHNCSHVHNVDFIPAAVSYNTAGCRMFNSGSNWQDHIKEVYGLIPGGMDLVVEIGAGDCSFLSGLHTAGVRLAIDPCSEVEKAEEHGIQYIRDTFKTSQIPEDSGRTLIIMRHLLEHMQEPRILIEEIARMALVRCEPTWVYIEVPNCENALRRRRIEDWTYEHPQHFTVKSLRALLHSCWLDRFGIVNSYGGEVLCCLVQVNPEDSVKDTINVPSVLNNYGRVQRAIETEGQWLRDCNDDIAYWGGAGKSAMFLRLFNLPESITVVDSHDEKWGMCVPGTKTKIQNPDVLLSNRVKYIIATASWRANDIRDEIKQRGIPCQGLMKFEFGRLVEVPLGN
jgi:hypothetical protein